MSVFQEISLNEQTDYAQFSESFRNSSSKVLRIITLCEVKLSELIINKLSS